MLRAHPRGRRPGAAAVAPAALTAAAAVPAAAVARARATAPGAAGSPADGLPGPSQTGAGSVSLPAPSAWCAPSPSPTRSEAADGSAQAFWAGRLSRAATVSSSWSEKCGSATARDISSAPTRALSVTMASARVSSSASSGSPPISAR